MTRFEHSNHHIQRQRFNSDCFLQHFLEDILSTSLHENCDGLNVKGGTALKKQGISGSDSSICNIYLNLPS